MQQFYQKGNNETHGVSASHTKWSSLGSAERSSSKAAGSWLGLPRPRASQRLSSAVTACRGSTVSRPGAAPALELSDQESSPHHRPRKPPTPPTEPGPSLLLRDPGFQPSPVRPSLQPQPPTANHPLSGLLSPAWGHPYSSPSSPPSSLSNTAEIPAMTLCDSLLL